MPLRERAPRNTKTVKKKSKTSPRSRQVQQRTNALRRRRGLKGGARVCTKCTANKKCDLHSETRLAKLGYKPALKQPLRQPNVAVQSSAVVLPNPVVQRQVIGVDEEDESPAKRARRRRPAADIDSDDKEDKGKQPQRRGSVCDADEFATNHATFMNKYLTKGSEYPSGEQQKTIAACILMISTKALTKAANDINTTQTDWKRRCMSGDARTLAQLRGMLDVVEGTRPDQDTLLLGKYNGHKTQNGLSRHVCLCGNSQLKRFVLIRAKGSHKHSWRDASCCVLSGITCAANLFAPNLQSNRQCSHARPGSRSATSAVPSGSSDKYSATLEDVVCRAQSTGSVKSSNAQPPLANTSSPPKQAPKVQKHSPKKLSPNKSGSSGSGTTTSGRSPKSSPNKRSSSGSRTPEKESGGSGTSERGKGGGGGGSGTSGRGGGGSTSSERKSEKGIGSIYFNLPTEKALQVRFDPKYLSKVRENTLSEINPDFEVVLKDARKQYTTKSVPSCVHVKFHAVLPVVKLGKFAMTMWHALDGKFAFNGVQQRNSMALVLPSDKHIRELLEDKEFIASASNAVIVAIPNKRDFLSTAIMKEMFPQANVCSVHGRNPAAKKNVTSDVFGLKDKNLSLVYCYDRSFETARDALSHTGRNYINSAGYVTDADVAQQPRLSVVLVTMETLRHYYTKNTKKKDGPFFDVVFVAPGALSETDEVEQWFDCNLKRKPKYDPRSLMLCTFASNKATNNSRQ